MTWIDPVFDRTKADVENRTPKGFMNVSDWNRIAGNIQEIHDEILARRGFDVPLEPISTFMPGDIPSVEEVNAVPRNIELLRTSSGLPKTGNLVKLKTDWPSPYFPFTPDYSVVNAWEKNLAFMRTYLHNTEDWLVYAGVGAVGQGRLRQNFFRR